MDPHVERPGALDARPNQTRTQPPTHPGLRSVVGEQVPGPRSVGNQRARRQVPVVGHLPYAA